MKLQAFLFSILALPLYYQCDNNSQQQNQANQDPQTEQATQQSQTDPSIAQSQVPLGDTSSGTGTGNKGVAGRSNKNPFGVLIAKTDNQMIPPAKQIEIARILGVNYMRGRITVIDWKGSNDAYDKYAAAGFKIILNINYDTPRDAVGNKKPIPFLTDMQAYGQTLNSILDKYKPELAVIENEEDNPGYHSGTAEQYLAQLKTAIEICHAHGVKVTNGGFTNREIALLAYDDLMQNGKKEEANAFAHRAFPERYMDRLNQIYQKNAMVARQLEFGRTVIKAYKTMDLDYVNFHWYEPTSFRGTGPEGVAEVQNIDPEAFRTVANYLKRVTGKPIVTNEFGQLNTSPAMVQQLMQQVLAAGMDYAIWYSADGGEGKAVALQSGNGSLKQNGIAFRDFIKEHCR